MVDLCPHIMTWIPMGESTTEPGTGYEIPGVPGVPKAVACRFHLGGTKTFRNEDNTVVNQVGRIRVEVGSEMPPLRHLVSVTEVTESGEEIEHFKGRIQDIYHGQLKWRLDV